MKICTKCGTIFEDLSFHKTKSGYICPIYECRGVIENIDDLIIPAVSTMIKKGWKTEYSCSGHYGEKLNSIYIMTSAMGYNSFIKNLTKFIDVLSTTNTKIPITIEILNRHYVNWRNLNALVTKDTIAKVNINIIKKYKTKDFIEKIKKMINLKVKSDNIDKELFSLRIGMDSSKSINGFNPKEKISNPQTVNKWFNINLVLYEIADKLPIIN